MKALEPPALLHLESAKGWHILGCLDEALADLQRIPPEFQTHPDVLEVHFAVHAQAKKWVICMEIAAAMLDLAPERPTTWINSAFTLHEMKQTQEAWDALVTVQDRFPDVPTIPYNLACYACQLGRLDDARTLLKRAFQIGGSGYRELALEDGDLKPLWEEIKHM
ncbi:MAG: tetratricopeptide repeat protein [Verrucomicrobia subdivision 3 bacterium]|nr:tetratricopeptide repeat protein [Limisphaerales bacterium]